MTACPLHVPSVLFSDSEGEAKDSPEPAYFHDLNLDQLIERITAGRKDYALDSYFHTPLRDVDSVRYRQDVFHDLEQGETRTSVEEFTRTMRRAREYRTVATNLHARLRKQRWLLDAAEMYCDATQDLLDSLHRSQPRSIALQSFREYLTRYISGDPFQRLLADVCDVRTRLVTVRYCVHLHERHVQVSRYRGEPDYSTDIAATFARFKQREPSQGNGRWSARGDDMNRLEEDVLALIARLYPEAFSALDEFCARHEDPVDAGVAVFDREVQFYLAYLDLVDRLSELGHPFAYPELSTQSAEERVDDGYDLALASRLSPGEPVVRNGFELSGRERVLVVTGPNQGGKTTFARMFGQLHYLAALGCPVPARAARLMLPDQVFTHFEREEDLTTARGRLEAELARIHETLQEASGSSVVVMNETFSGTTAEDALFLGRAILRRMIALGNLAVYVTFIDELAELDDATVSMVGTVDAGDPTRRTYRLLRQPPNGLAHAEALAERYDLTYDALRRRLR